MKRIFVLIFLLGFFIFSCGDDKTDNNNNNADKCKDVKCAQHASCNPDTGKCDCDEGYVSEGTNCVEDDACKDVQCPENSACKEGNCICNEGYHKDGDLCVKDEDDKCKNIECGVNEYCVDGECVCQNGYFYSEEVEQCIVDEDCQSVTCDEGSSCYAGICYPDNECSLENPDGYCPEIEGYTLVCKNGLCVTQNEGSLQEGENCVPETNDCVNGTVCVDAFNNGIFKCRAFCNLNSDGSCGEDGICAPYMDDYIQYTGICIKSDSECENGNNCPDGFTCETMINSNVCKNVGSGDIGDECDNDPDTELEGCKEGLFCVGDEGEMKCYELCDPENEEDNCNNGRCVSLKDVSANIHNNDIGVCSDLPDLCNTNLGVLDNPMCEEEDAVCLGRDDGVGACFVDECSPEEDNCEEDIEKCTRSFSSKYACIPAGNLEYQQEGCVNPENPNVAPEDIVPDKLCKKGLVCFQNKCMEFCDPTAESPCVNATRARCVDFHTFKADFPQGLNGVCMSR